MFGALRRIVRFFYHDLKVLIAKVQSVIQADRSQPIIHIGQKKHSTNTYAIFLIWQPDELPWYVKNALKSLNELNINVLTIVNHPLDANRLSELQSLCCHVMVRNNVGFDIGAYKDGTRFIRGISQPSRVFYLNDSVYYFEEGLEQLFRRMAESTADVVAPFENHEYTYHIQSFCFAVSGLVFSSSLFQGFWEKFLPVNSRVWAISQGEVALSKIVFSKFPSVEILYTPQFLRPKLLSLSLQELYHLNDYLPKLIRLDKSEPWGFSREQFIDLLLDKVTVRSQIHTGAFLYQRFLGCPMMKRDLVYRMHFSLDEVERNLYEVRTSTHIKEIVGEARSRGMGRELSPWNLARFAEGLL
ncbi:rhamnan synthesis F family protein [Phyllobacterium ifriqiyense]|uniref:rhamnan synthesis F family protein n=1 Tax=Phyllobacterium ifriqiyense TaxID=314238 RepID=UPI003397E7CA